MFVLFCSCRDVAWWLSTSESTPPPRAAPVRPQVHVAQNEARCIRDEVQNLNAEILYLLRFQNFLEMTNLHLNFCCNSLEQCCQLHNDEHLGHVQLWEFLNKHAADPYKILPTDRSRMKHICRQYYEKLSNLFLLAGVPVSPPPGSSSTFEKISKSIPQIKYSSFRDQMMYRFKDSWNVANAPSGSKYWKDPIQIPEAQKPMFSQCCRGNFTEMSFEWTPQAGLLLQDVLGRLYDHSSALFPSEKKQAKSANIDPIKQREISKLINSFRSNTELATLPECERALFVSVPLCRDIFDAPCVSFLHFCFDCKLPLFFICMLIMNS
jgi:hypothetical protein